MLSEPHIISVDQIYVTVKCSQCVPNFSIGFTSTFCGGQFIIFSLTIFEKNIKIFTCDHLTRFLLVTLVRYCRHYLSLKIHEISCQPCRNRRKADKQIDRCVVQCTLYKRVIIWIDISCHCCYREQSYCLENTNFYSLNACSTICNMSKP